MTSLLAIATVVLISIYILTFWDAANIQENIDRVNERNKP